MTSKIEICGIEIKPPVRSTVMREDEFMGQVIDSNKTVLCLCRNRAWAQQLCDIFNSEIPAPSQSNLDRVKELLSRTLHTLKHGDYDDLQAAQKEIESFLKESK